ncbi:facilitated trehalose transporter Tret1-like [Sitodiplosis mosellana]|uniref:facilitated trehalose transporter Tret1-like n=1 Tax=Sitodiplosis mosellana TaxID=263140 RepID=UPI002443DDF7|nr:facilitated trehalose transporter Tret1-like [Sitodiplosis mosellana]
MILVNVPLIIAWFLMYTAGSVWQIFVANILLGLGVGLMESPVITYIGEITEPSYRGILIAYTNVFGSFGMMLVLVLNTMLPWRMVGLVCMFIPIFTVLALCFVPETPLWLLSKNRVNDAEKALCWLRGWAPKENVSEEFQALQRYSQRSKSCSSCIKKDLKCTHPLPTMLEKLRELKRKQTLKPLFIVVSLMVIAEFTGITGMNPFLGQIFKAYESPIAPDQAMAILGFVNNFANIVFLCLIRFTGKRKLYFPMLTMVFLCSATVSAYGFAFLPNGYNSFDHSTASVGNKNLTYIPFVCLILWSFCSYCGVNSVPWQMLSEVYPFKARGIASGLSAALDYFFTFVSTKLYYDLETSLSMPGIALVNCIITGLGLVLIYNIMPETENRTLEDIEFHFSDNSKKLTDRKIARVSTEQLEETKGDGDGEIVKSSFELENGNDSLKNNTRIGCDSRGFVIDA